MADVVLSEKRGKVGILTINRPEALNAINSDVMDALISGTRKLDEDEGIGCIVLTGSEKAFVAGADIKEKC